MAQIFLGVGVPKSTESLNFPKFVQFSPKKDNISQRGAGLLLPPPQLPHWMHIVNRIRYQGRIQDFRRGGGPTDNFSEMAYTHKIAKYPKIFAIFTQKKGKFPQHVVLDLLRLGPFCPPPPAKPLNTFLCTRITLKLSLWHVPHHHNHALLPPTIASCNKLL